MWNDFNGAVTTAPSDPMAVIAERALLNDVMAKLCHLRPVFHSEADLQHSFARVLWELASDVDSRLEVPQRVAGKTEYLDLLCLGPESRTAIEFKYFTRSWTGTIGLTGPSTDRASRTGAGRRPTLTIRVLRSLTGDYLDRGALLLAVAGTTMRTCDRPSVP